MTDAVARAAPCWCCPSSGQFWVHQKSCLVFLYFFRMLLKHLNPFSDLRVTKPVKPHVLLLPRVEYPHADSYPPAARGILWKPKSSHIPPLLKTFLWRPFPSGSKPSPYCGQPGLYLPGLPLTPLPSPLSSLLRVARPPPSPFRPRVFAPAAPLPSSLKHLIREAVPEPTKKASLSQNN